MKPGEHPDFFRLPPPEGRSRESSIRLDSEGSFFHDGERVEHPALARALHTWLGRHPENGRYILTNGYDWTYVTVDDVPFFVVSLRIEQHAPAGLDALLLLSDGTEEPLEPASMRQGPRGEVYLTVKRGAAGGPYDAKLTRFAQTQLAPLLHEENGAAVLETQRGRICIPG